MPLNAKLVVVGGEVKTAEIKLRLPSTIGRGRGTTIMLPHPLVSRQHCELFEAAGKLMVRDMGSLNGTFVNNQRITESAIEPGELLTIGAVTFRAVYEAVDAGPPGPPTAKAPSPGDTNISSPANPLAATMPADEIVDVEMEELEIQETSSVSQPMGTTRADATIEDVVDIADIEEVEDEGGATRMAADLKSTQPAPGSGDKKGDAEKQKGVTPPAEEEDTGNDDDEEDDFQDFLKSMGN